ncbi:MAG: carbohydrate binding family 9 domain-containing protein [Acidobacteria bacterium]|jgi:hypothetical protein|nr:carbohydrate binding family 9 domain-containing protein [Acidobacteriota bacterium]
MKKLFFSQFMIIIMLLMVNSLPAIELTAESKEIIADRLAETEKIVIDGKLDETLWQRPSLKEIFITMAPTYGNKLDEATEVWCGYDNNNLYFAFKCLDTQPGTIKTSIAQRDKIETDDQVAVWLDTVGTQQSSYEFYMNPNGIQMDGINSSVSRGDFTPDFIWESAGKIDAGGYCVEMRIPLESIRHNVDKNKEIKMRCMFFRKINRLGVMATWPEVVPGKTDFNCMTTLIFRGIDKSGLKMEILPNFTYSGNSQRITAVTWDKSKDTNIGVSLKYGITSSITAEATVNPDFSQVESDVFQIEVNQRYSLFYSEKRPFFMESQDVLDFTIVHDTMASVLERGMMMSPIHTRNIIDPGWAGKLSGTSGKINFALLAANDRSVDTNGSGSALFGIFRAKYNIGSDNSLGVLYTGRHFDDAGETNDVAGVDLKYRLSDNLRASLSYLHSFTRPGKDRPLINGNGWNMIMQYLSARIIVMGAYERYDKDFFMASAFQNRVGISRFWFGFGPYFNIELKPLPWLKRIIPYIHYANLHDLGTKMNDISRVFGMYMNFAPMGDLYLEYRVEDEAWKSQLFKKKYFTILGQIQPVNWLYLNANLYLGGQINYDAELPFLGNDRRYDIGVTFQPGLKLKIGLNYIHSDFKDKQSQQKIYSVNIYNMHMTYQFNKYFFLRGILRFDDLQQKLLTDLLASFTLIPGTVVHLGYGSLYLKNQWDGNAWIPGQGDYLKMRQGLFFKASYLWRIK